MFGQTERAADDPRFDDLLGQGLDVSTQLTGLAHTEPAVGENQFLLPGKHGQHVDAGAIVVHLGRGLFLAVHRANLHAFDAYVAQPLGPLLRGRDRRAWHDRDFKIDDSLAPAIANKGAKNNSCKE